MFQKRFKSTMPLIVAVLIMSVISFKCQNLYIAIRAVICILFITASCKILYDEKIYVYTAFTITILYMFYIIDIIFGNLFSLIFSEHVLDIFYSKLSYRLIVCLIIKIVNILSIVTVYRFFTKSGRNLKKDVWILFNIIMSGFLFFTVSYMILYPNSNYSNESVVFFLITSISFFVMSLIVICFITRICANFNNEKKLYLLESNYSTLKDNMIFQHSSSEKLKKIRHDMRNHFMTVDTLLKNENILQARQLLNDMTEQIDSIKIELTESTGYPLVDAIILQNAAICENKHISFSYKLIKLPEIEIRDVDLSSVLSNLLSNAIEAAEKTDEPFINLNISIYKSFLSIAVENSYCNTITISANKFVSSKSDSGFHGYGTQIISDVVSKYDGDFSWEIHSSRFMSSVLLNMNHNAFM